jgi:hypothetical protein
MLIALVIEVGIFDCAADVRGSDDDDGPHPSVCDPLISVSWNMVVSVLMLSVLWMAEVAYSDVRTPYYR